MAQALAARLGCPVAIDDPQMHLLAHTPQEGPVDEARLDSILRLQPPAEVTRWALEFGIAETQSALRLPANDDFELLPRVCAPIRCQGLLLGYIWLIDKGQRLTDSDLRTVEDTAESVGLVLYRDQLLGDLERGRRRELLRDLLSDDDSVRQAAADSLVAGEHFVPHGSVTCVVVQSRANSEPHDETAVVIEDALARAARHFTGRHALSMARADHGVLVASMAKGSLPRDELDRLAESVRADVAARTGQVTVAGLGSSVSSLVATRESYEQARRAIRVAEIVSGFGPTVAWKDLGIYSLLVQLPLEQLSADVLHPGLLRLFQQDPSGSLVQTLEVYLDHAGDARSTIAALAIHRTSLYYRLSRIEELTGIQLSDGGERLSVHLGLKLARLAGRHPGAS